MPLCNNCGEEDFECIDGWYYCLMCQTQSQDLREEEYDEGGYFSRTLILSQTKDKSEKVQKVNFDPGRPWQSCEAFQHILKMQVNALISLGASEKLRDVVFRIWVQFLSKAGIAFTEDSKLKEKQLAMNPRLRDFYPSTLDNPEVKSIRRIRSDKRISQLKAEKKLEKRHLQETLVEEEFYEGDNPLDDEDFAEDEQLDALLKLKEPMAEREVLSKVKVDGGKVTFEPTFKKYHPLSQRVERLNMRHTLSICHLGLLFTNNLVMAADIIRWVQLNKIPYRKASQLLPEDMKCSSEDWSMFKCGEGLTAFLLHRHSTRIAKFIGIRHLPQVPIQQLVSKYILELNLPGELHGLVRYLIEQKVPNLSCDLRSNRGTIPRYEIIAMSYIIMALKILFGLDDETEGKLSAYAKGLSEVLPIHPPLFVWDEWVAFMDSKQYVTVDTSAAVSAGTSLSDFATVQSCLEKYRLQRKELRYCEKRQHGRAWKKQSTREEVKQPLVALSKAKQQGQNREGVGVTGRGAEPLLDTSLTQLLSIPEEETMNGEAASCSESIKSTADASCKRFVTPAHERDFRTHSLRYITDGEQFLETFDKQGLSDYTIYSSCLSSQEEDDDEEFPPHSRNEDCDQPPSPPLRKKTRLTDDDELQSPAQKAIRSVLKEREARRRKTRKKHSKVQLSDVLELYVRAHERYVAYQDLNDENSQHHLSYEWLLTLCANHIFNDRYLLHAFVEKLHAVYLVGRENIKKSMTRSLICFESTFFKK